MTTAKKLIWRGGMLAAMVVAGGWPLAAGAVTTAFDTTLADPPGVYFGTGNVNLHFTTGDADNIELGLGTVRRFIGPVTPEANSSTYNVLTGFTGVTTKTGTDWGFVFSINTDLSGTGPLLLTSVTTQLCVQDVGQGTTNCFDPQSPLLVDNSHAASAPTTTLQNSEALQFDDVVSGSSTRFFDPAFDPIANDTYIFTLTAKVGTDLTDSVQMTDIAGTGATVPEPSSLALFGVGLIGLARVMRRKRA
jgi:hypothetical protein